MGFQTTCYSQIFNHQFGITPISLYTNKGVFFAQGINYIIEDPNNRFTVSTEGTIFEKLDARKRDSYLNYQNKIPFLNQSVIQYSRIIYNGTKRKPQVNRLFIDVGYHYFQHGSQPANGYWSLDSISNNGIRIISGFKTHSASLGFKWENIRSELNEKDQVVPVSKHSISTTYIFGLDIKLQGFEDHGQTTQSISIANDFIFETSGFKLNYQFERILSNHLGLYTNFELLYIPFVKYIPDYSLFTPRGGERIYPFFPSLKLGLNIFRHP